MDEKNDFRLISVNDTEDRMDITTLPEDVQESSNSVLLILERITAKRM